MRLGMKAKRAASAMLSSLLLLLAPALIAPHVSEDPIAWAYRVYHPFLYRMPNYFASVVLTPNATWELEKLSGVDQSLEVLGLMIQYW